MLDRADLSRTVVPVVALCLTVAATGVGARELRAEATEALEQTRAGAIDLNRIHVAPIGNVVPPVNVLGSRSPCRSIDEKPFEAAMAGIHAKARRDPAAAQPIGQIGKVD